MRRGRQAGAVPALPQQCWTSVGHVTDECGLTGHSLVAGGANLQGKSSRNQHAPCPCSGLCNWPQPELNCRTVRQH